MSASVLIPSDGSSVLNSSDKSSFASSESSWSLTTKDVLDPADSYRGYDHVTWYVGNAKHAASYYITRMGFREVAYRGLETGSRYIASHVVSNNRATFVFTSPIRGPVDAAASVPDDERHLLNEIHAHLSKHGDAVKDVAFNVDDVHAVYQAVIDRGGSSVRKPTRGQGIEMAVIGTYGDTTHTLINRKGYAGAFMPGYRAVTAEDPVAQYLPEIPLEVIDHCVGNQDWDQMQSVCN